MPVKYADASGPTSAALTPRWYPLIAHPQQIAWMRSKARFNVIPAGRRSGKTERAKRKLVMKALSEDQWRDAKFFAGAPTREQAKRIWWEDLKALSPRQLLNGPPREGELYIEYVNGARIYVVGLDKPQRMEGQSWNGGVLDEYADMKPRSWELNIRPALSDRKAWCDFIGVPEGRNHYWRMYVAATEDTTGEWAAFTWRSAEIIPAAEIESARATLDKLSFEQEYEASFVNFHGRVYYTFERDKHTSPDVQYDPNQPLVFCLDFNVSPGVAVVLQEQGRLPGLDHGGTAVIGQVHIPSGSNTQYVCNRLITDWGERHKGTIYLYGDATGGATGTAKVSGSDWDLAYATLRMKWKDIRMIVPDSNPAERARVNAVNRRFLSENGTIRMMINAQSAPQLVEDLEGVRCVEGGSGEIDKENDPKLTHISDALGYYVHYKWPSVETPDQREFLL